VRYFIRPFNPAILRHLCPPTMPLLGGFTLNKKENRMALHMLEIEVNAEGNKLAYLSPTNEKGETQSGYRLAGPKAWGGSKNIARLKVSTSDIVRYIKEYAPDVLTELTEMLCELKKESTNVMGAEAQDLAMLKQIRSRAASLC